ncbi:AcrR family transcriptional regulator [Nakamurella sp. UYEF19]|uniref:TetR/AcrR family transcriptional regulator n=1 Tax=Nakamurella sp. UYEF19 TaxID=1756392 RepID=UPI0033979B6B
MNASVTARELARASLTAAIKDAARSQVAEEGAARLSFRAVAREVGMVSSAVYRYFPTRDDLLTALIVDAYDALGSAVERAVDAVPPERIRARWRAFCGSVRNWAQGHPQEYGLIFGSPIPGYRAPADTIGPAARVPLALIDAVRLAWAAGTVDAPASDANRLPGLLQGQLSAVAAEFAPDLPASVVLRMVVVWTQLFGMVSFELFGQLVGTLEPADEFFAAAVDLMADFLGIEEQ